MRSATLSGWPSETDSEVNRNSPLSRMYVPVLTERGWDRRDGAPGTGRGGVWRKGFGGSSLAAAHGSPMFTLNQDEHLGSAGGTDRTVPRLAGESGGAGIPRGASLAARQDHRGDRGRRSRRLRGPGGDRPHCRKV